jgi:pimeloyl-ACP methyl ester carboxylesterase
MTAELYREVEGSGEPILLIHGNGANTRIWGRSADDLAASHRVIAYDRRGFGRSPGPPATSMRDHVADAAGLLRELEAAPATVVGWSGGGVVAAGLAIEHPDLVGSLVLSEAGIHLPLNPTLSLLRSSLKIEFARRVKHDKRRAAQELFDFALSYRGGGTQFERWPTDWQESMLASAPSVVAEIDHLLQPYPSRTSLPSIGCPVTLLQGGLSERTFAKVNRYLRKRLPEARLVEIEGTAHAVHFDRPEEFRDAVLAAAALASHGTLAPQ